MIHLNDNIQENVTSFVLKEIILIVERHNMRVVGALQKNFSLNSISKPLTVVSGYHSNKIKVVENSMFIFMFRVNQNMP